MMFLGSLLPPVVTTTQPLLHPNTTMSITSSAPNITQAVESNAACGMSSEADACTAVSIPPLRGKHNDSAFGNPMEVTKSENVDSIPNVETALSTSSSDCAVLSKCLEEGGKRTKL